MNKQAEVDGERGGSSLPTITIDGFWYGGRSSSRQVATLHVDGGRYRISTDFGDQIEGNLSSLDVSDRIGDIQRQIRWPTGEMFETGQNDRIDQALALAGHADHRRLWIHRMERNMRVILLAVLITVSSIFAFFRWGLPTMAEKVAQALPVSAHETVARGALRTLDEWLLEPSELDASTRNDVLARFADMAAKIPSAGFEFTLHFRNMGGIPNAFALPGGDIVVTDALVELAEDPEEIDAVILHEIGHVVERHGMQHAIRATSTSVIIALALGDVSGVSELAVGIPTLLLQNGYSRQNETDADQYAFDRMSELDIDPIHFATIIRKLGAPEISSPPLSDIMHEPDSGIADDNESRRMEALRERLEEIGEKAGNYLSTHPGVESRALSAEARSLDFRQDVKQAQQEENEQKEKVVKKKMEQREAEKRIEEEQQKLEEKGEEPN